MKKVVLLAMAVILSFVFWSCQGKQDVVRVGAVLPLTGSAATYGVSLRQGIDLAIETINASGGIGGRKLEVIYEDSKGDARIGVSAFNKLVTIDRIPLVFGSLSSIILAIQPEADRQNVVLMNTSAINPRFCEGANDFLFNLMVNSQQEMNFFAKEFQSRFPNEKVALLYCNNASGVHTRDVFVRELSQLGNSNHVVENYDLGATDFRVQLERIKRSGAKFGYLFAFSNKEFADIIRQTKEQGLDIQWYSFSAIETRETIELAGEAANGIIYSYPKTNDSLYSILQTKFGAKYDYWADIYAVTSYEGTNLVAKVMNEHGTTALDIQKGLRSIEKFDGIFGYIKFNIGNQCVDRELVWKKIENGQFKIME